MGKKLKKRFVDEEGKEYETVLYRPWYKKWYFWTILVLIALIFISTASNNYKKENNVGETSGAASQKNTKELKKKKSGESHSKEKHIYKANEEVMLENENGNKFSITIKSASSNPSNLPSYMQKSDKFDSSRIISINFSYKNYDLPKSFNISTHELQVYDEKGHGLKRISSQAGSDKVDAGRSADSQVYFMFEDEASKPKTIQIDYVPHGVPSSVATIGLEVTK